MRQIKPLTARELATYKPPKLPHKLPDGDGLFLCFLPSGKKVWRYRVRIPHKDSWTTLGYYPEMTLAQARRARDEAKRQIKDEGITPAQAKRAKETGLPNYTFEAVASAWLDSEAKHTSQTNAAKLRSFLSLYLIPSIGNRDITTLKKADLLEAAKAPLAGEKPMHSVPRRLAHLLCKVFEFARLQEIIPDDRFPDAKLVQLLPKTPPVKHHACLTEPQDIGRLLRSIQRWYLRCQVVQVGLALRLMPYVFLRAGELTGGLWEEVNFDAKLWTIPAERMKKHRPHVVPLSRQAVEILKEAKVYAGESRFIFPSIRAKKKGHVSGCAMLAALRSLGWNTSEEMSIHGFRGVFTTIANEAGYRRDAIEMQMAHVDKNAVRSAYNHAQYMPERKALMQEYADYLDSLQGGEEHTMQEWKKKRNS